MRAPRTPDFELLPPIDGDALPEIVDLAQIDLDFAGDEPRHTDAKTVRAAGGVAVAAATIADLLRVELFRGVAQADLAAFASDARIVEAAPGSVIQPAAAHSDRIFFVIAGELRMYADFHEKRARGMVDPGQSVGLSWALMRQPVEVAIVASETSRVLELRLQQLEAFAQRSHAFACNLNALYAAYLRGDNCLNVGARALAALHHRRGYTDELTQLHNESWLATMLPRLLGRSRFDRAPLTIAMFAVDKLEEICQEFGSIAAEQILAAVGQLLLDIARTTDLLVCDDSRRFLAILPNTTLEGGRHLSDRVLQEVHSLRVGAPDEEPLPALTLSCGIASFHRDDSASALLQRLTALLAKPTDSGTGQ